ncbi:MarR family transcriptional regulator [Fibrella sp. HMF5335]|uniref:MarR family transcriptional regulator n=1 Tax=Fibrella rubiginis TaxID=2817060 RepID=A0A939K752_9BACT|nr:MarR family transcriptional regulator [Fibrella rubiginis]MBO0939026.1 MarR family transcriptional regulator [Fibrella rubiginis]
METANPLVSPAASTSRYGACLLFAANALARAVTVIGDAEFAKLGLSYSHAYLLNEVAEQPGQTPTALSETLFLSPSTITRLIEKLEGKGLVRRQPEGKRTLVFATDAGQVLAPAVATAWQENWAKFANSLGEEEAIQLTRQIIAAAEKFSAAE